MLRIMGLVIFICPHVDRLNTAQLMLAVELFHLFWCRLASFIWMYIVQGMGKLQPTKFVYAVRKCGMVLSI